MGLDERVATEILKPKKSMDLRVVILPSRPTGSGISIFTSYLAKALDHAGANVKILGFGKRPANLEACPAVRYLTIGKDPGLLDWVGGIATTYMYIRKRLHTALQEFKENVDIFHFVYPEAAFRPPTFNGKVITSAWGFSSIREIIEDAHRKFSRIWCGPGMMAELQFYYMDRRGFRLSDGIICTTTEAERFWGRQTEAPITYLPIPIEIPHENRQAAATAGRSDTITLMLGERDLERPRNNISVVLKALLIVHLKGLSNFEVHLVGRHGLRLKSQVSLLRGMGVRVHLHPYLPREKYVDLLRDTDVCLVPRYIKDQGGFWPLEAMARGIPVVASNIPAFWDFVVPGKNGLLINPYDPLDLADNLQVILEDPQLLEEMKTAARRFIKDFHGLEVVGPKYAAFYDSVGGVARDHDCAE